MKPSFRAYPFYLVLSFLPPEIPCFAKLFFSGGIFLGSTVLLIFAGTTYTISGSTTDWCRMSTLSSSSPLYLFLWKNSLDQEKNHWGCSRGDKFCGIPGHPLIRPTNILLLTWMFFLDTTSLKALGKRVVLFLKTRYILVFIIAFLPGVSSAVFHLLDIASRENFSFYYPYREKVLWTGKNKTAMIEVWFSASWTRFFLYTPLALYLIAGTVNNGS